MNEVLEIKVDHPREDVGHDAACIAWRGGGLLAPIEGVSIDDAPLLRRYCMCGGKTVDQVREELGLL
jgi:hypothetical protein